ncbi:MAG: hypothetical protein EOP02_40780 [Proteobacteria bacterium]|nr:MAG: hypothetical protein EOP02_40780 [Pseudomonadota bacterium]
MTVWIVVSILALILSPMVWLRPSRSQSGRMAVRMQARRMGLAMQLACAQYHRPRRKGRVHSWSYWQTEPGIWCNQWRETCVDPHLLPHLATLPPDVYKLEAGPQMLALYWGEKGDEKVLQNIAKVLQALA